MSDPLDPTTRARLEGILAADGTWRLRPDDRERFRALLEAYDQQAAQLADIWLLVDLWDRGTEGGLETLERLVALKETDHVD